MKKGPRREPTGLRERERERMTGRRRMWGYLGGKESKKLCKKGEEMRGESE